MLQKEMIIKKLPSEIRGLIMYHCQADTLFLIIKNSAYWFFYYMVL